MHADTSATLSAATAAKEVRVREIVMALSCLPNLGATALTEKQPLDNSPTPARPAALFLNQLSRAGSADYMSDCPEVR